MAKIKKMIKSPGEGMSLDGKPALSELPPIYRPTPRQCALLLLRLIALKEADSGKELSRLRVSELTLKRIWCRKRIPDEFIVEVGDWLYEAGRAIFYSGRSYAVVRTNAVEGWPRISSKSMSNELQSVVAGSYDFDDIECLLRSAESGDEESD